MKVKVTTQQHIFVFSFTRQPCCHLVENLYLSPCYLLRSLDIYASTITLLEKSYSFTKEDNYTFDLTNDFIQNAKALFQNPPAKLDINHVEALKTLLEQKDIQTTISDTRWENICFDINEHFSEMSSLAIILGMVSVGLTTAAAVLLFTSLGTGLIALAPAILPIVLISLLAVAGAITAGVIVESISPGLFASIPDRLHGYQIGVARY